MFNVRFLASVNICPYEKNEILMAYKVQIFSRRPQKFEKNIPHWLDVTNSCAKEDFFFKFGGFLRKS